MRARTVRALACIWSLSVVAGFLLRTEGPLRLSTPVAVWTMLGAGWVAAGAGVFYRSTRLVTLGLVLLGLLFGSWRGGAVHTLEDALGHRVTGIGTIVRVYPGGRITTCEVEVTAQTEDRPIIRGQGRVWIRVSSREHLAVGDAVQVAGTLTLWSSTNNASATSRMEVLGRATPVAAQPLDWSQRLQQFERGVWQVQGPLTTDDVRLLQSLVFGDDNALAAQWQQAFLSAGLLHVLAASGANLLILERCLLWCVAPWWRRLRWSEGAFAIVQMGFAWLYAAACLFQVSMIRAAMMTTHRWTARALGRNTAPWAGLFWSAVALASIQPRTLCTVGAALSWLATAAVERAMQTSHRPRHDTRFWRTLGTHVWQLALTTLRVELWLQPLVVGVFQQYTPYAVLANVCADPLLAVLLPAAALYWVMCSAVRLGWVCVGWLCPLGWGVHQTLVAFTGIVRGIAGLPWSRMNMHATIWFWGAWLCLFLACERRWMMRAWHWWHHFSRRPAKRSVRL
ncbi:hypothetical protein GCM10025857_34850 [Alicyclobacillus contaminans]|uniref:ComEC/Rec2 family competence protein n=1 Tax=Alicyclobacillus contaminans TaxID=392016 RepID=UPI00047B7C0C|nr:ComEC/Rec2 family competence protein [Alicyclobacillus contaminans]GMA52128.1 hypothetical protein GCM10025857_34850 [Alicyclobacillus contaminans]